jgi:thymidylate synthase
MNYDSIIDKVLVCGVQTSNRTGVFTRQIPAAMFEHNGYGFPAVTRRKLQYKAVVAELLGFLNGYTSAASFRKLGANIWDANANENKDWLNNRNRFGKDDMGRVYGAQWRDWRSAVVSGFARTDLAEVDQIRSTLQVLESNPESRRMLVSAWNPGELDQMCLPPCHFAFQLIVDISLNELHLNWYQRSVDVALGLPFNIASYATLQHLIAKVFGYKVGQLNGLLSNVHVYENHFAGINQYLGRPEHDLPTLEITLPFERNEGESRTEYFMRLLPFLNTDNFTLVNYECGSHIGMEMVV